jgi:tRNA dimethylallyltransferase
LAARDERTILLAGPTASGKSALALALAEAVDGVIINADSMQIYAAAPILTAQPGPDDRARRPHRLYGVAAVDKDWSVGHWLRAARAEIAAARAAGQVPILVGGTGLYFHALTHGLAAVPPIDPLLRDRLRAEPDLARLRADLARHDPAAAARLMPNDRARITRALEVVLATGRTLADWQRDAAADPAVRRAEARAMVVAPERAALHARIDRRFDQMMTAGALEEVARLTALGLPLGVGVMKAIGIKPLSQALQLESPLEAAVAAAKAETRQYAKRQETWFRNQMPDWERVAPP